MAENNLGQIVGIWLEPTEPPHKNVLWIKTINLLTSEKVGFIWNGTEWINIQGQGFYWKGEFDIATNYTKNDVVLFNQALYIKLNDVVNNEDNPDENSDFELFLPASNASGVTGSIQTKDADGKFFGSNLLTWLAGLLSILGNVLIKGLSSTVGDALTVQNNVGTNIARFGNDGWTKMQRFGFDNSNYILSTGASFAFFISGVYRVQLLSTGCEFTVPISVSTINGLQNVNSSSEVIFRSGNGSGAAVGFDMRYYAGRGGNSSSKSGTVLLGYKQQNNTDVNILSIQERTPNSTDGVARVIFKVKEVYADNAAALGAGLPVDTFYRTPTGEIRTVV